MYPSGSMLPHSTPLENLLSLRDMVGLTDIVGPLFQAFMLIAPGHNVIAWE